MSFHRSDIGQRFVGKIDRVFHRGGGFGFIVIVDGGPHHENDIHFRLSEYNHVGSVKINTLVEFELQINEKGWTAVNIFDAIIEEKEPCQQLEYTGPTADDFNTFEDDALNDKFSYCEEAAEYYILAEDRVLQRSQFCLSMASAHSRQLVESMEEFRADLNSTMCSQAGDDAENEVLKASWAMLDELALAEYPLNFDLDGNREEHFIENLKNVPSFRIALENYRPTASSHCRYASLVSFLRYFDERISVGASPRLAWPFKAGWMLKHAIKQEALCNNNMTANAFLLVNYCLVLRGPRFPLPLRAFEDRLQESSASAAFQDEAKNAEWIMEVVYDQWRKFEEFHNRKWSAVHSGKASGATPRTADQANRQKEEEALRDKAIIQYREGLKRDNVCFVCMDDDVRPTVALLCCGQACHVRCLSEWHSTRGRAAQGTETCPSCRQDCAEPRAVREERRTTSSHGINFDMQAWLDSQVLRSYSSRAQAPVQAPAPAPAPPSEDTQYDEYDGIVYCAQEEYCMNRAALDCAFGLCGQCCRNRTHRDRRFCLRHDA